MSLPAHYLLHLGGQCGDERHVASKNKEHYHKCFIGENCFQRSDVVYPESKKTFSFGWLSMLGGNQN